jgi:hypothetical protein
LQVGSDLTVEEAIIYNGSRDYLLTSVLYLVPLTSLHFPVALFFSSTIAGGFEGEAFTASGAGGGRVSFTSSQVGTHKANTQQYQPLSQLFLYYAAILPNDESEPRGT